MQNPSVSYQELISENIRLKQRLVELETSETALKKAEEALAIAEQRYNTIFETTGTTVIIINDDMTISHSNNGFLSLTGYTRDEIEGNKKWTEFIYPEDLDMMIASHKSRREHPDGTIKSYEFRLIHRDGIIKNVLITIDLLPGTKSSIASLIDITDRKKAEESLRESEKMYRQLFMNAPAAIYEVDYRTRRFTSINDIIPVLTGYSRAELMEMDPWELFTEESKCIYIERMNMMKDHRDISSSQEYSLRKKDGGTFWVNTNINYTIENGLPVKARIVAHDITERKKAEEEREKLISELKKALSDIKTLSGLLPICASCKKIRDDKGYWNQIESYIQSHSGAEFSHGICPDCAKKLYPEYYKDK